MTYSTATSSARPLELALNLLLKVFRSNNKLLLCGNGGSAADCDHIVAELMKGMDIDRTVVTWSPLHGALPAISLCSHVALMTAIANDIGPRYVFAQQVFGWGRDGDALLAITTSGQSENVLEAIKVARASLMHIITLTGPTYSDVIADLSHVIISVPGRSAAEIQEGHIRVYHELCSRLEQEFFG